jgi:hypothetical protein
VIVVDVVALVAAVVVIAVDVVDSATEEVDLAAVEVAEVSFFSNWLPNAGSQLQEAIQFQIWGT